MAAATELSDEEQQKVGRFGIFSPADGERAAAEAEAERIGQDVDYVRNRLAVPPQPGLMKTPDEMIDDLEWAKYGNGQIALALKQASLLVRSTRAAFTRRHAKALLGSSGKSAEQREAEAALACEQEQLALDAAEVAFEYARNTARGLEQVGTMTQTQASVMREQMRLAGTGRES